MRHITRTRTIRRVITGGAAVFDNGTQADGVAEGAGAASAQGVALVDVLGIAAAVGSAAASSVALHGGAGLAAGEATAEAIAESVAAAIADAPAIGGAITVAVGYAPGAGLADNAFGYGLEPHPISPKRIIHATDGARVYPRVRVARNLYLRVTNDRNAYWEMRAMRHGKAQYIHLLARPRRRSARRR